MAERGWAPSFRAVAGKAGEAERVDPTWVGWSGPLAHPRSPQGGGGPGGFALNLSAKTGSIGSHKSASPYQPGPLGTTPVPVGPPPRPANPAPVTTPRSLGVLKSAKDDLREVAVDAEIASDTSGKPKNGSAVTRFALPSFSFPSAALDRHGKITHFNGKFTWKGTIRIQTVFGPGSHPNDLSCYGRGTTDTDVRMRDITLGFHESCHRHDYEAFLKANPLPDLPELTVGMSGAAYQAVELKFQKAFDAYSKTMGDQSLQQTDEVGNKLSTLKRTHKCFTHILP